MRTTVCCAAALLACACQSGSGLSSADAMSMLAADGGGDGISLAQQSPRSYPAPASPARRSEYNRLLRESYEAFRSGDYEKAMLGYERVLARAEDPRDQVRALTSLAMIRLLPSSKAHDVDAGAIVLQELERRVKQHDLQYEFFGELELLRLVAKQEQELRGLRAGSSKLRRELAARDDLIRQLRALSVTPE